MTARETLRRYALEFALGAAVALHPGLWRRMQRSERRGRERPLWVKLALALVAAGGAVLLNEYRERNLDRWMAENPEVFEGLEPPRRRGEQR